MSWLNDWWMSIFSSPAPAEAPAPEPVKEPKYNVGQLSILIIYKDTNDKIVKDLAYISGDAEWVSIVDDETLFTATARECFEKYLERCLKIGFYNLPDGRYIPVSRVLEIFTTYSDEWVHARRRSED